MSDFITKISWSTGACPVFIVCHKVISLMSTVLPARSDSDLMFCLQSYQGHRID